MKKNLKNKIIKYCLATLFALFAITPSLSAMKKLISKYQTYHLQAGVDYQTKDVFLQKSKKLPISYLMEYVERDNIYGKAYVYFNPVLQCMGPDVQGLVIYRDQDKNFWLTENLKNPGRRADEYECFLIKSYCQQAEDPLDQSILELDGSSENVEEPCYIFDCNPDYRFQGEDVIQDQEETEDESSDEATKYWAKITIPQGCKFQNTGNRNPNIGIYTKVGQGYYFDTYYKTDYRWVVKKNHIYIQVQHSKRKKFQIRFQVDGATWLDPIDNLSKPIELIWEGDVINDNVYQVNKRALKIARLADLNQYLNWCQKEIHLYTGGANPAASELEKETLEAALLTIAQTEAEIKAIKALQL